MSSKKKKVNEMNRKGTEKYVIEMDLFGIFNNLERRHRCNTISLCNRWCFVHIHFAENCIHVFIIQVVIDRKIKLSRVVNRFITKTIMELLFITQQLYFCVLLYYITERAIRLIYIILYYIILHYTILIVIELKISHVLLITFTTNR